MRRRAMFRRRRRGRTAALVAVVGVLGAIGAGTALSSNAPADSAGPPTVAPAEPAVPAGPTPADDADEVPAPHTTATADAAEHVPNLHPARSDRELAELGEQLGGAMGTLADSLTGTDLSVVVIDERGRTILDHGGDQLQLPASTMKAITGATVLEVLGPDHRFTTRLAATGPVTDDGGLAGDLVLIGGGDPVLTTDDYRRWVYPARPATRIEALADAVVDAGIRRIDGRLIVDSTAFGPAHLATGWPPHYLAEQDARAITALTVDAGLEVDVTVHEDGQPPEVELRPAPHPARRAGEVLAAMLAERGVELFQPPGVTRAPVDTVQEIAAVRSPPVAELLTFTMRRSDNHLADTLLRAAAAAHTGRGTWSAAQRTVEDVLADLDIPTDGLRVADGSGLSRADRVTAAQLAAVDAAMAAGPHADVWNHSLAVAGEAGTLRHRLVGTAGQGRFRGKTGTLDDVKAVVGHVLGADGERVHMSVISNGLPVGGQWAVTVLMDTLQLAMVDYLDGCHREPVEDATESAETVRVCPDAA